MTKFVAKPMEVDAFQYGVEKQPAWYLTAVRKGFVKVTPAKGHIVAKTPAGKINLYDPKTFNALFETVAKSKDLNKDGKVDKREEALATETKKKRKPRTVKPKEE